MVKGTTRQVLVVKGVDTTLFEQAIFLVRDDVLEKGGVTEEALLEEAREVCSQTHTGIPIRKKAIWAFSGAGATGVLWLLTALL